jgi:hypothetical protein
MAERTFIEITFHPQAGGALDANGSPVMCLRCRAENRRRAKRAVVTAIDVTGGTMRLPVAYCQEHVPDEMGTKERGNGVIICFSCGRPTSEHTMTERCYAE